MVGCLAHILGCGDNSNSYLTQSKQSDKSNCECQKVRTCGRNPLFFSHNVKQQKKRNVAPDKQLPVEVQESR